MRVRIRMRMRGRVWGNLSLAEVRLLPALISPFIVRFHFFERAPRHSTAHRLGEDRRGEGLC